MSFTVQTDRQHLDGKNPICKYCKKKEIRDLYAKQPERFRDTAKRAYVKNKDKAQIRELVSKAIRKDDLIRPNTCSLCGHKSERPIEAHHWRGYEKEYALDIQWLCRTCHRQEDSLTKQ